MSHLPQRMATVLASLLFALPATAQETATESPPPDRLILKNGDQLTGTIKTMVGGVITLTTPSLGDITVPLTAVENLVSGAPLVLRTTANETLKRRVTGVQDDALQLAAAANGPGPLTLDLADLEGINPAAKPVAKWTGSFSLGANVANGNTERRSVGAAADAKRRTEQDRLSVKAAWDYAEEQTSGAWNLTQRRLAGDLAYNYFLSKRAYALAQTSAVGDTQANLDLRYTTGVGVGYQWHEGADLSLSTEAGLSYFAENYRSAIPDNNTVAARIAYSLQWKAWDGVSLLQDAQIYPGLEQTDDVYLTVDTRARMSLTEAMFAQLQWVLDYDNTPSPGFDRVDNRFLLQVGWSF